MRQSLITGVVLLLFLVYCTEYVTVSTETDTGEITGWVVDAAQKGVGGADVILRNADWIQVVAACNTERLTGMAKRTARNRISTDSTKTSPGGFFRFRSVTPGNYYIEVNDHDSMGAVVKASLADVDSVCVVDSIVPGNFGAIRGRIDTTLIGADSTFLYIVEIDRKVPVDSLGYFLVNNIPAVDYTVRLVDGATLVPSVLDTVVITVTEQDTADLYNDDKWFEEIKPDTVDTSVSEQDTTDVNSVDTSFGDIKIDGIIREY